MTKIHEAIRPTSTLRTPYEMKAYLTRDQHRLYKLIWERFVASQMAPAIDTVALDVTQKTLNSERMVKQLINLRFHDAFMLRSQRR